MYWAIRRSVLDGKDRRKTGHLHIGRRKMKHAVKSDWRHQMYEKAMNVSRQECERQIRGPADLVTLSRE